MYMALHEDISSSYILFPIAFRPAVFLITHAILLADSPSAVILTTVFSVFTCLFPIIPSFILYDRFILPAAYHLSVLRISIRFI